MGSEAISVFRAGKLIYRHSYRDKPLLGLSQTMDEIKTTIKPALQRIFASNPAAMHGEVKVRYERKAYAFSVIPRARFQYELTEVRGDRWQNVERVMVQLAEWVAGQGGPPMTRAERKAANKAAFAASRGR